MHPLAARIEAHDVEGLYRTANGVACTSRRSWRSTRRGDESPGTTRHGVERCDAVRLGQRREVEDRLDEGVDLPIREDRDLADVHQLGSTLPDDLDAEDAPPLAVRDQLQQPVLDRGNV